MSIKLRISITKEVLEDSAFCPFENDALNSGCAITLAIRQIWPTAIVGMDYIMPFGYVDKTSIKFPHNQREFTFEFDGATPFQRAAMQPFSFEIEVPDEVIVEVNIEEIRDIIKNSKTLELV